MFERLFRRTSCPIPNPAGRSACLRPRHLVPLAGFIVPSVVIGYGLVLPHAGFSGVNELSIGFATTLMGAAATYVVGVMMALRR
ncbi:MAG: hypothetical protein M4D80_37225 [Myxococcota bacterium]|nr:hypothetical protein [Myxococcota bacterium]